jgi:hypothetical protein
VEAHLKKKKPEMDLPILGWREWVSLPELGIHRIKAKVDTGARTSAIHAFAMQRLSTERVRFAVHPIQKSMLTVWCEAQVVEDRWVSDSGGNRELRPVILTAMLLGDASTEIEVTLTTRSTMLFRMLLGRTAINGHYAVNPAVSFLMGKRK